MAAHVGTDREVELGGLLASSASDEGERQEANRGGGSKRFVVGVVGGVFVLALLGVACVVRSRREVQSYGATREVVSFQGIPAVPSATTAAPPPASQAAAAAAAAAAAGAPAASDVCSLQPSGVPVNSVERTEENLVDGNKCRDSEEEYGESCLRKCECLLTPGTVVVGAVRKSEFSCCDPRTVSDCTKSEDPLEWATPSIMPCQGFAVSSANDGTACPHMEGACLENEEQNLQMCYKKCSILTANAAYPAGEFPYRISGLTCAKTECADIGNVANCIPVVGSWQDTSADYDVGGGCGDGDEGKKTPCSPHYPLKDETEAKAV